MPVVSGSGGRSCNGCRPCHGSGPHKPAYRNDSRPRDIAGGVWHRLPMVVIGVFGTTPRKGGIRTRRLGIKAFAAKIIYAKDTRGLVERQFNPKLRRTSLARWRLRVLHATRLSDRFSESCSLSPAKCSKRKEANGGQGECRWLRNWLLGEEHIVGICNA